MGFACFSGRVFYGKPGIIIVEGPENDVNQYTSGLRVSLLGITGLFVTLDFSERVMRNFRCRFWAAQQCMRACAQYENY